MKTGRHYADNREKAPANRDLLSEHSVVGAEALLPELITQNRDEIRALAVFIVREPAADKRLDTQRREKTRGHELGVHFNGIPRAGEILAHVPDRCHFLK